MLKQVAHLLILPLAFLQLLLCGLILRLGCKLFCLAAAQLVPDCCQLGLRTTDQWRQRTCQMACLIHSGQDIVAETSAQSRQLFMV